MRAVDWLGLAMAVVIAGLAQIVQPFTPIWWGGMFAAGMVAAASGLHIVWNKLPKSAQAFATRAIWRPNGYLRPWIGVALLVVILVGGYISSHGYINHSPFAPKKLPAPPVPPQKIPSPGLILSTSTRFIFACAIPPDLNASPLQQAERRATLRNAVEAWGAAIGFDMDMTDIPSGIRITIEAKTSGAKSKLISFGILPAVTKINFELRRIGQQIIVTVYPELPPQFDFFAIFSPDPTLPQVTLFEKNLDTLLNAEQGACHLI
jgi:hypothetical protein